MVAVAVILVCSQPRARVLRARPRCRCSTSPRRGSATACIPVGLQLQEELSDCRASSRRASPACAIVKGFGVERLQRARLAAEADSVYDRSMDQAKLRAELHAADRLPARRSGWSASSGTAGTRCSHGHLTVGDIVAANLYVLMMIWPLRMIGMLARAAAALGRGRGPHQRRARRPIPRSKTCRTPSRCPTGRARCASSDVTFGYGRGRPVLDGLDLVIRGGEAIALVGATGVGQDDRRPARSRASTTSTPATSASTAPTCATCASRDVRRAVGLVFEDTFLFSDTVRSNIAFADPEASMEAVVRAAQARGRRRVRPRAARRLRARSSASTATRSRAGSGSASRSRARCSPTRAS